jgi:hypothetical protein
MFLRATDAVAMNIVHGPLKVPTLAEGVGFSKRIEKYFCLVAPDVPETGTSNPNTGINQIL